MSSARKSIRCSVPRQSGQSTESTDGGRGDGGGPGGGTWGLRGIGGSALLCPYFAYIACMQLEETHWMDGGVAMCKTVQTVLAHGSARLAKGQQICHWLITSFLEDHDEYILTIR